jgi:hypothetical protein
MEIAKLTEAAIIVSSDWRHLGAMKHFLGPSDDPSAAVDGSSLLEAQVLDANDNRGLWIELNSGQKKWPDRPAQKLMIPWQFVLAIVLQPDLEAKPKGVGYPPSTEETSGSPESTGGNLRCKD